MNENLLLTPVEMTPELMQTLESKGLIQRLYPGRYRLNLEKNVSRDVQVYSTDPRYGPHLLIAVTVNTHDLQIFEAHDDHEDFLLIGDPDTKPLIIIVATCKRAVLDAKIQSHSLSDNDFVAIRVRYNDPQVSFFTMLKDVPHGEVTVDGGGSLPTFYVTEPKDLISHPTNFGVYKLMVNL